MAPNETVIARRDATNQSGTADHPVVVVHSLAHAKAALSAAAAAGRPLALASAVEAGIYAGAGWWLGLIAAAREAVPSAIATSLLDCGDDAGAAQAAIRAGVEAIVFTGRPDVAGRLSDIASRRGVRLVTERPAADLELGDSFFAAPDALRRRCTMILAPSARVW